jgi:hypothetical protein
VKLFWYFICQTCRWAQFGSDLAFNPKSMYFQNCQYGYNTWNNSFCGYSVPTLFRNLQKEVFSVHGAWHSSKMLPTMVQGQAFRIITWQPPIYLPPGDAAHRIFWESAWKIKLLYCQKIKLWYCQKIRLWYCQKIKLWYCQKIKLWYCQNIHTMVIY